MDHLTLLNQPFLKTTVNRTTKSVDLSPLGDYWYQPRRNDDDPTPEELLGTVAWLYRGVQMRSNAVAGIPWRIATVSGDDYDTSDAYENKLGWLPNPRRLLYLTEAALSCYGTAYYWRERNRVATKGLRYIRPDTIKPLIDGDQGLVGFERTVNGKRIVVPVEGLVYFWQADPYVELGPPMSSPVMAAIAAAGVIRNLDRFSAAYFQRGAIKATLLTVSGAPVAAERDKLKAWWKDLVSGIKNAFATEIVNADSVTPVVIGEGLAELSNATLTAEKRQDIAQALGIPQSVMFSESARGLGGEGVASNDERKFYEMTVLPECDLISEVWNDQLLAPLGLRLEFMPDGLDIFQEDENQRATAFAAYVNAGLPIEAVGPMLGIELPQGWTWERIAAEKEERREEMAQAMQAGPGGDKDNDEDEDERDAKALADLRRWRTKSAKRGRLADFVSDWIPAPVMDDVKAHGVNGWRDALDGVIAVYEGEQLEPEIVPPSLVVADTTELVAALRSATEALLNGHAQPAD